MRQTVRALLLQGGGALERIDARLLLQYVLQVNYAWLIAHADDLVLAHHVADFLTLVKRREQGEPIAYLLGEREFYGLTLTVNPQVLIPRPETELLVDIALQTPFAKQTDARLLDLGTGSGAIAVAIAKMCPLAHVYATDQCNAALAVAKKNARRHALQIHFSSGSWFAAVPNQRFHLILSNPPYIARQDPHLTQGDLRFEPQHALTDYSDKGLDDIQHIIAHAAPYLMDAGQLWIEHGYDQAFACRDMLSAYGFVDVRSIRDLNHIERVSGGVRQYNQNPSK